MSEPARYRRSNGIATYYEARLYVDRIMARMREDALAQMEAQAAAFKAAEPLAEKGQAEKAYKTHRLRLLETLNACWQSIINDMARCVLQKRQRSKSRVTVKTSRWRGKALPSMSQSARRERGEVRRSKARSHVKGRYVPKNAPNKRGRIPISEAEKKRRRAIREAMRSAARRAATAKARAEKGWKPYRRARKNEFRAGWWESERRKRAARGRAIAQARAEIAAEKKEYRDRRKNHHPELNYSAPKPRRRRTSAQVAARGYSKRSAKIRSRGNKIGTVGGIVLAGIRAARATEKRIAGAREYWRKVKKRAAKIAAGARKVGRPLGSGDKVKRKRSAGANAGSFGTREPARNEALARWKAEKEQITKELRSWIGLATWNQKRLAAYRNDPEKRAQCQRSVDHRNQRVEAVRAKLAAHWAKRPR